MSELHISSAKIVPTPTKTAWSQIYNAGTFFIVILLTKADAQDDELGIMGKKLLSAIESEYFPLEVKTLVTIKQALQTALETVPDDITVSLQAATISHDVLYVFEKGQGSILLYRGDSLGTLLANKEELTAASGKIADQDLFLLATPAFRANVSVQILQKYASSLTDLVEELSPKIHGDHESTAAGLFIQAVGQTHKDVEPEEIIPTPPPPSFVEPELEEIKQEDNQIQLVPKISTPSRSPFLRFLIQKTTPPRLIILVVAIALIVVLIVSIQATVQNKKEQENHALFESIYPAAQKKYDEGQALLSLNKNLARDDFQTAKTILETKKGNLIQGSEEEKQVTELLGKISSVLANASGQQTVELQKASLSDSPLLALKNRSTKSLVAQGDKSMFAITSSAITDDSGKTIAKNSDLWTTFKGFGAYGGNFYILSGDGVSKLVPSGETYATSNYFASGISPDVSSASSLGIDGSIYILLSDGTIAKFTRGKPDSFTINGLDKPFSNPTQIVTGPDMDNLYILDRGNNRVVVLQKNGTFNSQYVAPLLKDATYMDVQEKNKKIYILKGSDVYLIPLK